MTSSYLDHRCKARLRVPPCSGVLGVRTSACESGGHSAALNTLLEVVKMDVSSKVGQVARRSGRWLLVTAAAVVSTSPPREAGQTCSVSRTSEN